MVVSHFGESSLTMPFLRSGLDAILPGAKQRPSGSAPDSIYFPVASVKIDTLNDSIFLTLRL